MKCRLSWLLMFLLSGVSVLAESASVERPNVVVFLVDDMGVMDTSVAFLTDEAGQPKRYPLNDWYRTPGMERLAATGIRLNNFCAMSVCSPTRISIMTGQNAARHRATNWINPRQNNRGPQGPPDWNWKGLNTQDVTLPGVLADAGYETIHVGKAHFGPDDSVGSEPLNLGFDLNVGGASFGAPGSYYGKENFGLGTKRAHHAVPHLEKYHGKDIFLTEALTIEAKARLSETVDGGKPFFLYMSHYAVHAPFQSDARFATNYSKSDKPKNAKAFATLIEGMDKSLNDLLDHLDTLGVAENTLVLFLGDNGSDAPLGHQHEVACAAPLRGRKGAHYEGGMRVPMIASWAKPDPSNVHQQRLSIPAGKIAHQQAAVHDLFPTILNVAQVAAPDQHAVDGVDMTTLLQTQQDESRGEVFLMHYPHAPHRSHYFTVLRDGTWKVVYHYFPTDVSNGSHYQLFDLANDPFESTDLSKQQPVVLKRMMQKLVAELERHEAVYPVSEKDGDDPVRPLIP